MNKAMSEAFSLVRFRDVTKTIAAMSEPYSLTTLLEMFDEITKLFRAKPLFVSLVDCLGQALSFATSDVTTNLDHITKRTKEMIEQGLIKEPYEKVSLEVRTLPSIHCRMCSTQRRRRIGTCPVRVGMGNVIEG